MAIQFPHDGLSQIGRWLSPVDNARLTMTCKHFYQARPAIEAQLRMDRRAEIRDLFAYTDRRFPKLADSYIQNIEKQLNQQTLENGEVTETLIRIQLLEFLKFLNNELLKLFAHENQQGFESFHSKILTLYFYETQRKIKGTFQFSKYQKFIDLAKNLIKQQHFGWAVEISLHLPMPIVRDGLLEKVACAYADQGNFEKSEEIIRLILDKHCRENALEHLCKALAAKKRYPEAMKWAQAIVSDNVRVSAVFHILVSQNFIDEGIQLLDTVSDVNKRDAVRVEACKILAQMNLFHKALDVFKDISGQPFRVAALKHLHQAFPGH